MNDDRKLRNILMLNTVTNYINIVWRMVTAIFITRIVFLGLGESNYGFWALLWTVFGYAILLDFGFGKTIQKYTSEASATGVFRKDFNNIISSVISTYLVISLVIIAITLVCAYFLDNIFYIKDHVNIAYYQKVFIVFGIGTAIIFPTGAIPEVLMGLKRTDLRNYVSFITYTAGIILTYLIFKWGYSLLALTIVTLAVDFVNNIVMYVFVKKLIPGFKITLNGFKLKYLKEIGSFSFYAYLYAIAVVIIYRTDRIVLGVLVSIGAVGIYQLGTRLSDVLDSVTSQFQENLPAVAAHLHKSGDKEKLRWILLKSNKLTIFIGTGGFIIFILLAKQIMFIWLKVTDIHAIYIAYIMLTNSFIMVLFRTTPFKFLQMAGRHKVVAVLMLSECVVNIALSITLVKIIGITGVAFGTLIPTTIVSVFIVFPLFASFSDFSIMYYLKKVYIPIFITSIPTVLFLLLGNYLVSPYKWSLLRLLVWIGCAGVIYLIMGFFFFFNKEEKSKYLGMIPVVKSYAKYLH